MMNLGNINTYIFDLDGTLLDTLKDLTICTNYALSQHGMPTHSIDDVRHFVGNGVAMLIKRAVPQGTDDKTVSAVLETFKSYYLQHGLDNTLPYPGIEDLLQSLVREDKKIAVVSNKFDSATKELCSRYFGDLITVVIGENEKCGIHRKPSPDSVFEAMKQLDAKKENTVYIGDSDVDILTAANAGLPCISVLWGFRNRRFLIEHGAEYFVSSPMQILSGQIEKVVK